MIASLKAGITASPLARFTLRYGTIALAITLFLLSIRRSGERVGRLSERLKTSEKANEIQVRMLAAAARRPRPRCPIPDDHISPRRSALFVVRSVLRDVRDGVRPC